MLTNNISNELESFLKLLSFTIDYIIFSDQPEVQLSRDREERVIREGEDLRYVISDPKKCTFWKAL